MSLPSLQDESECICGPRALAQRACRMMHPTVTSSNAIMLPLLRCFNTLIEALCHSDASHNSHASLVLSNYDTLNDRTRFRGHLCPVELHLSACVKGFLHSVQCPAPHSTPIQQF